MGILSSTTRATTSAAPDGTSHVGDTLRSALSLVGSETRLARFSQNCRVAASVSEGMTEGIASWSYLWRLSQVMSKAVDGIFQLFQDPGSYLISFRRYHPKAVACRVANGAVLMLKGFQPQI